MSQARDHPLCEVGELVLDRGMADAHAEREQAAFESNDQVPGTGLSPGRGQLTRGFSCGDEHRARLGEPQAP
ncbi:catalase [Streptomyces sp. NPDC086549]|uniref:catalase n=1 Tax=Streptomyces sp. NPDC086549 TaxID=3365752 RepID=UPI00381BC39C